MPFVSFLKPFGQGKALLGVEMVHYRAIFHLSVLVSGSILVANGLQGGYNIVRRFPSIVFLRDFACCDSALFGTV